MADILTPEELEQEVKNTLAMVENELCFGGNWTDARERIDRCRAQLAKSQEVCPELKVEDEKYLVEFIFQYLVRTTKDYNEGHLSHESQAKYIVQLVKGTLKPTCQGTGKAKLEVCPACAGSGQSYRKGTPCPRCKGTGAITKPKLDDKELRGKLDEILSQEVTIDEQVVTDRINRWDCHTGGMHQDDVDKLIAQIIDICQGTGKAKPDREKIAKIIFNIDPPLFVEWEQETDYVKEAAYGVADQIIALMENK